MNFFIGISLVIGGFIALFRWRESIAAIFRRIPLPVFLLYVFSAIPFIFIEESINCIDHGDGSGCTITPWIIGVLLVEVAILGLVVRKMKVASIVWPMAMFAILGAVWELLFGGLRGVGGPFLLFMFAYVMISYAFLVVVPLTILLGPKRSATTARS